MIKFPFFQTAQSNADLETFTCQSISHWDKTKIFAKIVHLLKLRHTLCFASGRPNGSFFPLCFPWSFLRLSSVYFFKWKIKNRTLWLLRSTHSNSIPVAKQQGPCTSTMNGFWAAGLYKQPSRVVFITTGVNTLGHTRGKENGHFFQIFLVLNVFPKCFQNSP